MKKYFNYLTCLLSLFCFLPLQGVVIGSNTAMSRQSPATFPNTDTNNTMLGFAAFEQGFTLQDYTTSCSYNDFYPISSTVQLNGGNLYLYQDLDLQVSATYGLTIATPGYFYGNNMTLQFSTTTDFYVPVGGVTTISPLSIYDTGQPVLSISWSYDSKYITYGDTEVDAVTLGFLEVVNNAWVFNSDATGPDQINCVRFHPSAYYVAVGVTGSTAGLQIYLFNPTSMTITQTSTSDGGFNDPAVAWHPSGNYVVSAVSSGNGLLHQYPFNSTTGALGTVVSTTLPAATTFKGTGCIDWAPSGQYLAVGVATNTADEELLIYSFNGASALTFTLGANVGFSVNGVSWSPTGSYIATALSGSTSNVQVYQFNVASGTLTSVVTAPVTLQANSVAWSPNGNYLGVGTNIGTNNLSIYSFNSTSSTLTLVDSVTTGTTINEVAWLNNNYIATGDTEFNVILYEFNQISLQNSILVFNNINMILHSNMVLRVPTKFQGNCMIHGNGNVLGFDTNGMIMVDTKGSLLCDNLTMTQVANRIAMVDPTSSLTLSNVTLELDNNFTFTQGFLNFLNTVHITGTNQFTYQSSNTAMILSESKLIMDSNMTFSYAVPTASGSLWGMTDQTSVWKISNLTLYSTTTGLQLTKGTLMVDGTCSIQSAATVSGQGIKFGDGLNAANDLTIQFLAGSGLNVMSGYLVYNNVGG